MPFLPIDMQTMFAQMNQVGREQSIQREVAPLLQALQGTEIARRTEQQDTSVNETREVGDGVEKVSDESGNEQKRQQSATEKRESFLQKKGKEVFTDPDLGHYIDITG